MVFCLEKGSSAAPGPSWTPVPDARNASRYPRRRCRTRCEHAGLRGPVRPPAAPDPAQRGRAVRGLAPHDRRRVPDRDRAHGDARPRRRDRVPAHRGDARGAQGPPPAARPRRRRARRGAAALRGPRPAPRPAARVQDVQGRGRRRSHGLDRAAPTAACPARPGPRSRSARSCPTRSTASTPAQLAAAARRALTPKPAARSSTPTTSRPSARACADAIVIVLDRLPDRRRGVVPRARRRRRGAGRGGRAVPRRARALQAGRGRPRPDRDLRRRSR